MKLIRDLCQQDTDLKECIAYHLLGLFEFNSLIIKTLKQDKVLEWLINEVSFYKDLVKLGKTLN